MKGKIDFNSLTKRRGTNSLKWSFASLNGTKLRDNQIPMWVADMDFKVAPEIIEELKTTIDFGIFGYFTYEGYHETIIDWCYKRYGFKIEKEWLNFTQGLDQGFSLAVAALTHPGEGVLLLTPTYYPSFSGITSQGCQIVESDLLLDQDGHYSIDYEDVDNKTKDPNVTLALLGNPHNPTGRLYTIDEMTKFADILIKNKVKIICDDIHCDIIVDPLKKYKALASIDKYKDHVITMNAPSKTFNLAGLKVSNVIISNPELRRKYQLQMERAKVSTCTLALVACKAAYSKCEYWIDELKEYIWGNYLFVKEYMETSNLKGLIKAVPLEGSYLLFADNRGLMKEYNLSEKQLKSFYDETCNLSLDAGGVFGKAGIGFMRFNLATQRQYVEMAMKNLSEGVENLKKEQFGLHADN